MTKFQALALLESTVPRGNTQKGVNKTVLREILKRKSLCTPLSLFDNPCGHGEWAEFLKETAKFARVVGVDLMALADKKSQVQYYRLDSSVPFADQVIEKSFDVATCISGVMAFDNISSFFRETAKLLKPDGIFIVTNDNFWTLRDRLSFFFLGRFRRFKLCYDHHEGNWNIVSLNTLTKALENQGFEVDDIVYTSMFPEDWFLLPLSLPFYAIQLFYLLLMKSTRPWKTRLMMYPPWALLARHYVIVAKKRS